MQRQNEFLTITVIKVKYVIKKFLKNIEQMKWKESVKIDKKK